jgi:pimeloyl-ACP methyl ester carboxylesterase
VQKEGAGRIRAELLDAPEEFESLDTAVARACAENPHASEAVLRRRVEFQTKPLPGGKRVWRYDPLIRDQIRSNTRPAPPDFWPMWNSISCPVLIVRGSETDMLTAAVAQRMQAANARATLVEVPRAGHRVFEDNPAGFVDAVSRWLGDTASRSTPRFAKE